MDAIRDIIASSEYLLLFLVIGIGFLAGQIRIKGFSLGISGVLFVGLFFGGWRPEGTEPFHISHEVEQVGLILFVYAVGLTSGPGFFNAMQKSGLRFNLAIIVALLTGATVTLLAGWALRLPAGQIAGVFCGGLTNTPALAAVNEFTARSGIGNPGDPAVGYSMAYPFGVIGGLIAFELFTKLYRRAFEREQAEARASAQAHSKLVVANFEIRNPELFGKAIGALEVQEKAGVIISRHMHNGVVTIPTKYTVLNEGDVVVAVGANRSIQNAEAYFGAKSDKHLEQQGGEIAMRRILVSRKSLAGMTIRELELDRRFNAQVTRLRRADIDMFANPDTPIRLGDRLRVVMPSDKAAEVSAYFGDSERGITEIDYTALTLGISIGVLIGMIRIPIPGGSFVSLGFAGGPLVAGLVLGWMGRTGPLVWSIPLETNNALRHIGLLFFLAGIGVMAGGRFFTELAGSGLQLLLLGAITTTVSAVVALLLLRHFAGATVVSAIGSTSGMQTQPATLAKAYELSQSDETYVAYATTYPVAMVGKILIAQLILILGNMLMP